MEWILFVSYISNQTEWQKLNSKKKKKKSENEIESGYLVSTWLSFEIYKTKMSSVWGLRMSQVFILCYEWKLLRVFTLGRVIRPNFWLVLGWALPMIRAFWVWDFISFFFFFFFNSVFVNRFILFIGMKYLDTNVLE